MQDLFQALIHLRAHAQGLTKSWGPDRQDHVFLHIRGVIGMFAPIQDIHHGNGQCTC